MAVSECACSKVLKYSEFILRQDQETKLSFITFHITRLKPIKLMLLQIEKITPKENGSTYGVSPTGDIPEPFGHNPVPCTLCSGVTLPEQGGWTR